MALELTMKRSKKPVYPSKTSINLAIDDRNQNRTRAVVLFAVALVAILLFAKFAVIDVMGAAADSRGEAANAQRQLASLVEANADYADLQERYAAYAVNSLSDEERALADRADVLNLLQSTVINMAELQLVSITGNTVQLQFANPSLEDVSRVVGSLESDELVANVAVSTAKSDGEDDVVSTVTVTLNPAVALVADEQDAAEAQEAQEAQASGSGTGA